MRKAKSKGCQAAGQYGIARSLPVGDYFTGDHLGSTAITANTSGGKHGELRYYPYGSTRSTWGTTPTTYRFTGQREESTIGLYFYNARWYDPAIGRFIQPDTIVPAPGNPQSLNRYSYVGNSPVCGTDPDGHCWPVCTALIGGAIGAGIGAASVALPQMIRNVRDGQPLTTNIDPAEVGKAAAVGFVSGAISGATAGLAAPGAGLAATVAVGALGNVLGGQAAIATDNLLSGRSVSSGMFQTGDMLRDAALGGGGAAITWGTTQVIKGAYASHYARIGTHNPDASMIVLGSHPDYVNTGKQLGHTYFALADPDWNYVNGRGIGWLTNEKFLDQQTAYQKIVTTVRGADPVGNLKPLGKGLFRETEYMLQKSGYQTRFRGPFFEWYPE